MLGEGDLDVLIKTGMNNPIAIGLAKSLLQEAGIPFFNMDAIPLRARRAGIFSAGGASACREEAKPRLARFC